MVGDPVLPTHTVVEALRRNQKGTPVSCAYLGPLQSLPKWEALGADKVLLQGIAHGVQAPLHSIPKPLPPRTFPEHPSMTTTIGEYSHEGAIRGLTSDEAARTRYWVPIFPREKAHSDKIRIIHNLRELNCCHQVPRHRSENVLRTLQSGTHQWALTMDLKSWFHHLRMHPKLGRWMRFQHQGTPYQLVAMPFGWAMSPWWANKLSKPIRRWLNQRGWPHCWWVDDILLLGRSREEVESRAVALIDLLTQLG